jgi:hypothetical protein
LAAGGLQLRGDHGTIEGIDVLGTSTKPPDKWPRNNLVLNCTSHDNFDPAASNANGFVAKLTCGEGNSFKLGGAGDVYREMPELASPEKYFWNGAQSANSPGQVLTADAFISVDSAAVPGRTPDGSIAASRPV